MSPRFVAAYAVMFALQQPFFHSDTRLVVVHATVHNRRGELVANLDRNKFAIYENGKRQQMTLFSHDDVPVSVGLLIDNSGSMRTLRSKVEAAALALARASNPLDEIFVLNFADTPHIDVPFTSDLHVLEGGIARIDSIGGTAMRDAVGEAETYLRRASRDRKALVVITDGNDNASVASMAQVVREAEQREILIFGIGLFRDENSASRARDELDALTERTGGAAYYPADVEHVTEAALEIARQIRSQYTLAYVPANQTLDGSFRRIKVEVAGADRLTAKTREGYWAR
jgi:Ca-activated chloride channel family protein